MKEIARGAASVLLALTLALAWAWTGWLKDAGRIDDEQRLLILVVLTLILAIQQIYLVLPKPAKRSAVEERRAINQHYLELFSIKYHRELAALTGKRNTLPVRLNVMLPTRRAKGLFGSYLQIYYYYAPRPYNDYELSLQWKLKEGTCGWAWKYKITSIFDSLRPDLQLPSNRVTAAQAKVIGDLKSVMSIPIWHEGKVVAVFNLDSDQNVADTHFDHPEIYVIATGFANSFGAQFYKDGVEA
jgi:hypothetical protein